MATIEKLNPGLFRIDKFSFPVDPISFVVSGDAVLFNKNRLSSEGHIAKTGYGDVTLNVNWILASQFVETGAGIGQIMNDSLISLYKKLTVYPFCFIYNDELNNMFPEQCLNSYYSFWVWRAMSISGGGNVPPSCLSLDMTFEICDTAAYFTNINFRERLMPDDYGSIGSKFPNSIYPNVSYFVPDGEKLTFNTSIGEMIQSECKSSPVSDISLSKPFNDYVSSLEDGANYVSNSVLEEAKLFTFSQKVIKTLVLPTDCSPPANQENFQDGKTGKLSNYGMGSGDSLMAGGAPAGASGGMATSGPSMPGIYAQTREGNLNAIALKEYLHKFIGKPRTENHVKGKPNTVATVWSKQEIDNFYAMIYMFIVNRVRFPLIENLVPRLNGVPGDSRAVRGGVHCGFDIFFDPIKMPSATAPISGIGQPGARRDAYGLLAACAKNSFLFWGGHWAGNPYLDGRFGDYGDFMHIHAVGQEKAGLPKNLQDEYLQRIGGK